MKKNTDAIPEYIVIGVVMANWGMQGHLKIDVKTDFPERFSGSSQVYIEGNPYVIESVGWHKGRAIVKLEGIDDEAVAFRMQGKALEIHNTQLNELPEDTYYHFELIGLTVKTVEGEIIGEITDVMSMSSADVYVVRGKNGEVLLPAIDDVIKEVDLENRVMVIEPVEGLLDLNERKPKQR